MKDGHKIMAMLFQRRADFYTTTTEGHVRAGADNLRRYNHPRWRWLWSKRYHQGRVSEIAEKEQKDG